MLRFFGDNVTRPINNKASTYIFRLLIFAISVRINRLIRNVLKYTLAFSFYILQVELKKKIKEMIFDRIGCGLM